MVRQAFFAVILAVTLSTLDAAVADTLIIDEMSQSGSAVSGRPARGQSMDKVQSVWGEPQAKQSPIGDPPISRWEYSNFTVYFEYKYVIHAVKKY